jgi:hypothetical protein
VPPPKPTDDLHPLDALAFVCEVAMFALLVVTGHGLVDGWRGWALGTFLGLVAVGLWAQWMAPLSARRLEQPTRLAVQIMLFVTVALYAAAGGLLWWGVGLAVVSIATFVTLARVEP